MRFFPPIVTGPVIICIGLTLANSAVNNCASNWWIALLAIAIVVVCNIWGKGMLKIIPILMGVVGSYLVAALCGQVDFSAVRDAAWIGFPVRGEDTVFALFNGCDGGRLVSSIAIMMPIALATMVEHIGDMCAISSTVGVNYVADPGLHRTLLGDGLATSMAAAFGAPANTTYGENTGVLALTKVYDPRVIRIAAVLAILFAFCPKFEALIAAMPSATIGGVSLILYGMISAVGVRNVVENQVDFTKNRNVIIAALILGCRWASTSAPASAATRRRASTARSRSPSARSRSTSPASRSARCPASCSTPSCRATTTCSARTSRAIHPSISRSERFPARGTEDESAVPLCRPFFCSAETDKMEETATKGFVRSNPRLSLCGLNCGLCPMNLSGRCSGCSAAANPAGLQSAALNAAGLNTAFGAIITRILMPLIRSLCDADAGEIIALCFSSQAGVIITTPASGCQKR